jgi:glycosyltransferase involved in cell wall biosynthesis
MRARGIDEVAITPPGTRLDTFGCVEEVPVYGLPVSRTISPWSDLLTVVRLVKLLRRIRPEIVHAHTPKGGLLGMLSATLLRVPVRVYTIHGFTYMTARGVTRALLRGSDWLSCRLADRVLCVSPSIRDVAIQDGICPPGKITVPGAGSANGVDAEHRFNPDRFSGEEIMARRGGMGISPEDLVVTFAGRIVRDKGVEELYRAWQGLREHYPDLHLVMAGPLEARDAVSGDLLDALRADRRVHLTGEVEDVSEILSISDVVAVPSRREGFGVIFIEAGAMRLPVVGTRIPGCVDAVEDGVTGTLVPTEDVPALRDAIQRYLDDRQLRQRHGDAGRRRVLQSFRQQDVWSALYCEYEALLAAGAGGVASKARTERTIR